MTPVLAMAFTSHAATYVYNAASGTTGDVLFGFRSTNAAASYSVVVDLGSISSLTNLSIGQTVTNYSGNYFSYVSTNNLAWSVLCAQRIAGDNRVWITRARSGLYAQSTPWQTRAGNLVGNVANAIDTIGAHSQNIAYGGSTPTNNAFAVVEGNTGGSTGSFTSYSDLMKAPYNGNPIGTFWGDTTGKSVEQVTSGTFTSSSVNSRADLYEIDSTTTNTAATLIGYFDLTPAGVLTFTRGASQLPAPSITSVVNNQDGTMTVSFTTVAGGTYQLVATDVNGVSGLPRSSWTPSGASITGDGTTLSITTSIGATSGFFAVKAN
jgi:hypothetical protein